jgi:hypothetical protein
LPLKRATLLLAVFCLLSTAWAQSARPQNAPPANGEDFSLNLQAQKLPSGVILIKGAWPSASDAVTPLPEGGAVNTDAYQNQYFGLSYSLPADWTEKYKGPPPSDSGYYVLAQLRPADTFKGPSRGTILIAAQDLFFSLTPSRNAMELVKYSKDNLRPDYKVERSPTEVTIANHSFIRFDYVATVADLHWYVLATQIRCHMVEFALTSRDTQVLESLIQGMNKMKLPDEADAASGTGGGEVPVCMANYATGENLIARVEPVLSERRFNPIPVRIIVGKNGRIKHIHFISAFPEQVKSISDALSQWVFKPYLRNGQPVEVETGIMFGQSQRQEVRSVTTAQ